ncbi:hypothetical protein PV726_31140 [Streptomyces europaeiscabiei]|uniref:hypothetical protein n=1 Tax=Streptomyces europaeiscabiei TaxID=146819 RepID=UPI0029B0F819|nr:hypothetical protein [Streptomyces europaeiscabiei]MDX3694709.1 hypothetical protein [Streptomyces europaeiscabiei]
MRADRKCQEELKTNEGLTWFALGQLLGGSGSYAAAERRQMFPLRELRRGQTAAALDEAAGPCCDHALLLQRRAALRRGLGTAGLLAEWTRPPARAPPGLPPAA